MNRLIDKAPSGASGNWKSMLGLSLAIALGSGLLLFALYQAQVASVAQAQSNTRITAEITAEEYDRNDDWSGFYDRRYGSVSPDNFNYQGINFEYKQIRYDDDDNELQIKFSKCIDLGEFVSLRLDPDEGSAVTVYKRDVIYLSVAETACPNSRSSTQRFDFNVSRNPLPDGAEVDMTARADGGRFAWRTYGDGDACANACPGMRHPAAVAVEQHAQSDRRLDKRLSIDLSLWS